jgi:hypothetical protein
MPGGSGLNRWQLEAIWSPRHPSYVDSPNGPCVNRNLAAAGATFELGESYPSARWG